MIGTPHRTLPELAAFANSVASRYLEGNDTYPGGGGHPNDNLLPVLAVAQASGASAQTAITAIVLAYEVHRYLFLAFPMRKHALDYVLYNAVASAAGSAKVLGLSLPQKPPTPSRLPRCPISAPTSAGAAISPCGRAAPPPTPRGTACSPRSWRRKAWPAVAAVLIDGAYTDAIFAPERFQDPRTLAQLMKKITIAEDAEFNKRYPRSLPCRMTITLKSGEQKTAELLIPSAITTGR